MIIQTGKTLNYLVIKNKSNTNPTLFLHGFSGSHQSWGKIIDELDSYCIALDIVGHGDSKFLNINYNYSIDDWCSDLYYIIDELEIDKIKLCGYSMGGRLAVAFAIKHPDRIEKLILESSSLGLIDDNHKTRRYKEDISLSKTIEQDIYKFTEKWEKNSLFSNQESRNKEDFLKQKKIRLSHNPFQLSHALKTFSQGNMDSYEDEFRKMNLSITSINGSEDSKYLEIGKKMAQINPRVTQHIIKDANHNVHLESPNLFAELIK